MIEACFKAFARALREAVAIDPGEDGRPLDQGDAHLVIPRARPDAELLDYGMGNLRSVEKALERVGAEVTRPPPMRTGARRRRPGAARGRRLPEASRPVRGWARRPLPGAGRRRAPAAGDLPRHAAALRLVDGERGRRGAGPAGGRGDRARGARAEGAAHRLGAGALGAPLRRWSRAIEPGPRSTSCTRSRRGRPTPATCWDPPSGASASRRWSSAHRCMGAQFHPEKSSGAGLRMLRTSSRLCAPVAGVILYPAIDIRGGRAVRLVQGDYDARDRLRRRPARRGAPVGRAGRGGPARRRPRRRPRRRAGERRRTSAASAPRSPCRSSAGAACATPSASPTVLAAGAERAVLGTAALEDPELVEGLAAEHGERIGVSVDARRAAWRWRAGRGRPGPRSGT